jgi:ATP dependent DNA ligase domain
MFRVRWPNSERSGIGPGRFFIEAYRRAVSSLPTVIPMAPTLAKPLHRPGWVYAEKYDGWRMIAYKDGSAVRLVSRNGVEHTDRFRELADAIAAIKAPMRAHRGCTGTEASMYRCAAAVAACSIAMRSAAAPLKRTSIPGCVSGRTSGGHTRTRARHRSGELWTTEGVTLIIQLLYSLMTGGWSAGISAALGTFDLCAGSDASM